MATEAQLLNALKNADAAGDTDAARKLASAVLAVRQQGGQQQPAAAQPEQPERYVDPNASRLMFSVDQAQKLGGKGIEAVGRLAGAEGVAQYGSDVVTENEADIARRGYQSTYQGDLLDQKGVTGKLGYVAEKVAENAAGTAVGLTGAAATATAAFLGAPLSVSLAIGATATAASGLLGTGEVASEIEDKTGDYNPTVAVGGGAVIGLLDRIGATKVIPKDQLLKMSATEAIDALKKRGAGKIARELAGVVSKKAAAEGLTEAAQEAVVMGTSATQGGDYTAGEVSNRLINSAAVGTGSGAVTSTALDSPQAIKKIFKDDGSIEAIENLTREHQQAAATFARRLDKIATGGDLNGNTFDLQDIDKMSQTGARAVVEAAHTDLVGEIVDKAGDLKELLRKSDQDTFDQRFKKVRAAVAQKMARNKTKSVVTAENFLALEDLVGGYTEGQALMNLIRESQIMTEVHNNDYQGKLSKFTDMFSVLGGGTGYDKSAVAVERVVRPIASLSFGLNTSGLSLLGQQAVASIGQRLDKARGTYSSVDKFIKENKDKAGLPAPRPPSFREQRLQQAQQASSTRAGLQAYNDKRDGGDNSESPVGKILVGTGLSPEGLNKLLDYIETAPDNTPDVMVYVDQTRRNLAGEGNRIDDISPWIQAINGTLNESEELDALREDQPDNPLAQRARRRAGFGPSAAQSTAGTAQQQQTQGRSPAVQQGIDDNRAFNDALQEAVKADPNVTQPEKVYILRALRELRRDLGSEPAVAAMDVVSRLKSNGISETLINRHIMPYVERVLRQQGITGTDLAFDQDFIPVPMNNSRMQNIFGVDEPTAGGNYINAATKEDATGQTYSSGTIAVTNNKPSLTTSDDQSAPADKAFGNKVKINLFKQKAGWKWVDVEDGPSTIVSTETRKDGKAKHFYSLKTDSQSPVTLQTYPNQPSEPRLRPTTHGDVNLGKQIGSISVRGKIHPVYDTITVAPRNNDLAFDEDFGPAPKQGPAKPVFKQTASLSVPMPVVDGQIKATKNTHGFMPHLRVKAPKARDGKPLFTIKTNNKNASAQINAIDEVLSRYPDPAESVTSWTNMMGDALATRDIPAPPRQFIDDINNGGAQELLSKLTAGQIADADHGFANAREFRQAYIDGTISVNDTGRLFLWSFLSKGVSPYTQESLFIDSFDGIDKWIGAAADGTLKDQMPAFYAWAETTAPRGSGQSGAGAMHNLNGFGRDFLLKMSRDAGLGDGRSRLQVIHDMMADPKSTGKEIRRQFMRMGEGVGVDNKVVSFTLLVAGFDDVVVMDRVQMRQMWNDGRFDGLNLYDGFKDKGKTVTGSQLSTLTNGARGLLIYEALEQSLLSRLPQIYQDIGRPEVASLGRYHWETWVASSEQEASHATIDAILARAKGDPNPLDGVMAKEGEYGAFAYGARYGIIDGKKGFIYNVPNAGDFKFTVPEFTSFLEAVRSAKSGVIPSKFRVSQSGNAPWYFRDEVNLKALAEKAKEHGKQVRRTDEELRQDQAVSDGRALDAVNGGTNSLDAGQSFDQEPAGILRSEQANDRGRGRSRRDAGGQLTPLEDAPVLRGHKGPIQNLVKVVEKYAAENNIPYVAQGEFVNVDPAFGARVAEAYDQMKDQPNDPAVKAAYADMIRQTKAQYDALVQDGYTFFFIDPASGYGDSPVTALEDLRLNKRMGIFPTDEGFGSDENATFDDNPLLEKSGETWANEDGSPKDVLYNDLFRAVHDAFGHGLEGSGFRARGEENAFQAHIRLFVGPARGAMTSETRGQNLYLNYGPHGENNQTASVEDTKFADQKIGVMPSWTWSENIAPDEMIEQSFDQDIADQSAGALTQQPQPQSPFNMKSLVNKMLGSQPATPDQVKAQLPEVRAVFEIGKKGTKYEKGIQNLDDALVLADALGLTVRMFDVQQDMMNAVGVGDRVRGVFRSSTKEVFGLKAGTPSDALGTITDLEALTTILHEIGHGMAAGVGPTEQSTLLQMDNDMNSDATMVLNSALTPENQRSNIEYALSGSFEAAMFPHLAIDYTGRGSKIQQEVINLQENIEVYLDKNISETRKVRKILQVKENAVRDGSGLARLEFIRHLQYVRGNREFAVDPLWVYMANPKLARAVMPMTTALIKKHFKDAQSTDIQFFAHPLAVSLAVVLAMMLNGRTEEEEEERQQMPAGALSPQAGALSQQQQFAA